MKRLGVNLLISAAASFLAIIIAIFITETVGYSVGEPFVTGPDPVVGEVLVGRQKTSIEYLRELQVSPEDDMRFKLQGGAWWISILLASALVAVRARLVAIAVCCACASAVISAHGAQHAAAGVVLAGVVAGIVNLCAYRSVRARPW